MSEPETRPVEHMDLTDILTELGKVSAKLTHALSEWAACAEDRDGWKARALRAERRAREAEVNLQQVRLWLEGERNIDLLVQLVKRGLSQ